MTEPQQIDTRHAARYGSYVSYTAGFGFSILLTLVAFAAVMLHAVPPSIIILVILVCATAQLFVQLLFFLHVGREPRPRWHLIALTFTALMLIFLVFGSLWIMSNLKYNTMNPGETDAFMMDQ